MTSRAVHVLITGKVQGVWYRGWTVRTAQALSLRGWVRNRRDGSVEAVFAGNADQVEAMLASCREGPPSARVKDVVVDDSAPAVDLPAGFEQRPTA